MGPCYYQFSSSKTPTSKVRYMFTIESKFHHSRQLVGTECEKEICSCSITNIFEIILISNKGYTFAWEHVTMNGIHDHCTCTIS